ncbi:hypothetical protein [Clostridium botulinum]|uniref:hypothetical protein n=1 Tax=Clostridium botulinum TaxID=1491 RepID=UPI00249F6EF5|nr:hypothetical protein [Clostridium botulinum]WGZ48066.1 hypothetical protein HEQ52_18125 [Clostridium botulinum]
MAEYLGTVKLGTFYHSSSPLSLPQRPWYSGNYPGSLSSRGNGDTPTFSGNISDWSIGDTASDDSKKLKWVKIKDGNKILLICTINILNNITWDTLNSGGYVDGKKIVIDGQEYLCRLLTGGNYYRDGNNNGYLGGSPTDNEWDRFICNEDNISGLPTPTTNDLDSSITYDDLDGQHNQLWNWWGNRSWCKETYKANSSSRVLRGFDSARYFSYSNSYSTTNVYGWRPVLEVLNSAPLISDSDRDLGNYASALIKSYTVSDSDGDKISIVEKLDNSVIKRLDNQSSSGSYTLGLSSKWSTLNLGKHNITIEATDTKGAKSIRVWTFTKTNSAPGKPQIVNLKNNIRLSEDFNIEFQIASDPEGDTQAVKAQVSDDSNFSNNLKEFKLDKEVTNANSGEKFAIKVSGLEKNTTKYIRVGSTDSGSNTTSWSDSIIVKIGNILEVQTLPSKTQFRPSTLIVKDKTTIDSKATVVVYVCNNALDENPTWEDITEAYKKNEAYEFTNESKIADTWAVAVRYVINANDATGEISIESIGVGVN